MKLAASILLLFGMLGAIGQPGSVDLRLRKNLRDKLDDLVFQIQINGRLDDDEAVQRFRSLFTEDANIYDFITPNYINQQVGREMIKPIDNFIRDVRKDFPGGLRQFYISDTNLGTAIDYNLIDWRDPEIQLIMGINAVGDYYRGGQFSNDPVLDLRLSFDTTSNVVTNLRITEVRKVESRLMFQEEARIPYFEKQFMASGFNSFVDVVSPSFTTGDYYLENVDVVPEIGYSVSFSLIRRFAAPEPEEFAWSVGIGVSEVNFTTTSDYYFYSAQNVDIDDDPFEMVITGSDLEELIRVQSIDIPIRFRYERKLTNTIGVYVNPGINLSYKMQLRYFGSGTFSYGGYYPQWDVYFEDLPRLNYVNDADESINNDILVREWNWNDVHASGALDIGFNFEFPSGFILYMGVTAFKNFLYVRQDAEDHAITRQFGEYRGIAPGITSISNGGYGIQIGFKKRFESKNGLVKLE